MTSTIWVRENGQADMRGIVRAAIKEAGLTQSAAAKAAGIKYTSLVGFLSSNNWFRREDAEALAAVVGVALDELVGGSIFRDQRDRYGEFDHRPAKWDLNHCERVAAWEALEEERRAELEAGRTRALCCECGTLRTCKAKRHRWDPVGEYRPRDGHRVTQDLRCFECKKVTVHAVLLIGESADAAETADRVPSRYADAVRERNAFIERLREFNVVVTYRRGFRSRKKKGGFFSSGYEFNTNTMQWEMSLDENLPPRVQLAMLTQYWEHISQDDHRGIDWDPRDGVWFQPSSEDWATAADDLLKDIERFMRVERLRMVDELRESAEAEDRGSQERQTS